MNGNDILKAVMPKNAGTVGTGRDDMIGGLIQNSASLEVDIGAREGI